MFSTLVSPDGKMKMKRVGRKRIKMETMMVIRRRLLLMIKKIPKMTMRIAKRMKRQKKKKRKRKHQPW